MTGRYLIKATYLEGLHKGETYLLRKGGYVTDEDTYQDIEDTYSSLGVAKRICKKLAKDNEIDCKFYSFTFPESYEPYEVDEGHFVHIEL